MKPSITESFAMALMRTFHKVTQSQIQKVETLLRQLELRRALQARTPKSQRILYRRIAGILKPVLFGSNLLEGRDGAFAFGYYGCEDALYEDRREGLLTTISWTYPLGTRSLMQAMRRPFGVRFGMHCIARVFQRNQTMYAAEARAQLDAATRFAAAYWMLSQEDDSFNPSVFVPSPAGAFLGRISEDRLNVELRTYVGRHQFSRFQQDLWRDLAQLQQESALFGMALTPEFTSRVAHILQQHQWPDYVPNALQKH
jgi:hypothetical protein